MNKFTNRSWRASQRQRENCVFGSDESLTETVHTMNLWHVFSLRTGNVLDWVKLYYHCYFNNCKTQIIFFLKKKNSTQLHTNIRNCNSRNYCTVRLCDGLTTNSTTIFVLKEAENIKSVNS